jgi:ribonuclease-3
MGLDEVQERLGVEFKDPDLLLEALTHSSCLNERQMGLRRDNESLAWLGDALIYWIVSKHVYRETLSTEELHKHRKKHINEEFLAARAVYYGLDDAMRITEGEEKNGGRTNQKNLHTVFEAVIGAIYMDKGIESAKDFVLKSCM